MPPHLPFILFICLVVLDFAELVPYVTIADRMFINKLTKMDAFRVPFGFVFLCTLFMFSSRIGGSFCTITVDNFLPSESRTGEWPMYHHYCRTEFLHKLPIFILSKFQWSYQLHGVYLYVCYQCAMVGHLVTIRAFIAQP